MRSVIQSLAWGHMWETTGGKSGATFQMSDDKRFVVKSISKTEYGMFCDNAQNYFRRLHEAYFENKPSVLARILCAAKLVKTDVGSGQKSVLFVIVMQNMFYGRNLPPLSKFDLKGTMGRSIEDAYKDNKDVDDPNLVRADRDLLQETGGRPLPLDAASYKRLIACIEMDTKFFTDCKV